MSEEIQIVRIAVIGVGSAGVAALKQAVDAFNRPEMVKRVKLDLVGYETRSEVGGLWSVSSLLLVKRAEGQEVRIGSQAFCSGSKDWGGRCCSDFSVSCRG